MNGSTPMAIYSTYILPSVFEEGKSKNSDYRRFKIKSVKGANDYDSMREILERRFSHGLEEIKKIQERN